MTISELLIAIRKDLITHGMWLDLIVGDDGMAVASISSKPDKWGATSTLMKDEVGDDIETVLHNIHERMHKELLISVAA